MKKIFSVILVIMLVLSFAACGNREEKAASAGSRQESGLENGSQNKEDKAQGNETGEKGETDDLQVDHGKIKESDLSDKYRTDLVPIFKGSVILSTMESQNHPVVGLVCYSKKPYKEVKSYYKKIMSKYEIYKEEEDNDLIWIDTSTYYVEARVNDGILVNAKIIDLTDAPDEYFDSIHLEDAELPKDAKTLFSLQFINYNE